MKCFFISTLFLSICSAVYCQNFVLACDTSVEKVYYKITEKELEENESKAELFSKAQPSIQMLIALAERHINQEQVALVAPSLTWPPEDYNRGKKIPIYSGDLSFYKMELHSEGAYRYWILHFLLLDQISSAPHETKVVCFLNGKIPPLVKKKNGEEE